MEVTLSSYFCFFFNDTATTEIYTTEDTLSLHDALPISSFHSVPARRGVFCRRRGTPSRSEEHTSELQSPSVISYAVFCLKKKKSRLRFRRGRRRRWRRERFPKTHAILPARSSRNYSIEAVGCK